MFFLAQSQTFFMFSFLQVLFLLEMMKLPWNVLNLSFTWQRTNSIMSLLKNQSYLHYHQKKGQKCFPGCVHLTLISCVIENKFLSFAQIANIALFTEWTVFGNSFCLDYRWEQLIICASFCCFFISLSIGIPVLLFQLFSCTSLCLFCPYNWSFVWITRNLSLIFNKCVLVRQCFKSITHFFIVSFLFWFLFSYLCLFVGSFVKFDCLLYLKFIVLFAGLFVLALLHLLLHFFWLQV